AIGIEPRDLPMLQAPFGDFSDEILKGSNDLPLETNMVLNIEVPFFEWGFGGMQKEHTIVVTERGYKFLTHQDRKLEVIR
ncbi:MAG: M24 family metallopeptidase, partial [Candidatus Tectomicrobia bacterium]|nr:M24 family metallopeptidase [Candidatus Tectomicrobia bacterium]